MKYLLRAFAVCAALLPLSPSAVAAPSVASATMVAQLDAFLAGTPMAGLGQTLFQQGFFFNVDPRLIVAIAGAQTNFGATAAPDCTPLATSNDPFYLLGCNTGGASFASLTAAVEAAAQNLKLNFTISLGPKNAVDLINLAANLYCSSAVACPLQPAAWAQLVESIYTNPALAGGGRPADLSFGGATIDFEQFTGAPAFFANVPNPPPTVAITVGSGGSAVTATFLGGATLNAASNLDADKSVVYGTADFCVGCTQAIDINFSAPVSTLSFYLVNGNTVSATYDTTDDLGNLVTKTVDPIGANGTAQVLLNDVGIVHVNINAEQVTNGCCAWDFFHDNITFAY